MIAIFPDEAGELAQVFSWFGGFGEPLPSAVASLEAPALEAVHFLSAKRRGSLPVLPPGARVLAPPEAPVAADWRVTRNTNPRLEIAKLTRWLRERRCGRQAPPALTTTGAFVSPSAQLGPGCRIDAGSVVGPEVSLGPDCHVMSGAVLTGGVRAASRCRFHPGCLVGVDGFGHGFGDAGTLFQIAHMGGVQLGNDVDVGPASILSAGTIDATTIDSGTKLDGHVYVGHNARIGSNAVITAGVVIGGSVRIGNGVWLHPGAHIKTKITIGDSAEIGIGSVVIRSIPANTVVMGDVAGEIRSRLRREAAIDRLIQPRGDHA